MLALDTAIRTALLADATFTALATNGAHKNAEPPSTQPPFLVWQVVQEPPVYAFGSTAYVECLYQVRGVGAPPGASEAAETIRDRAVAVLTTRGALTLVGYRVIRAYRQANLRIYPQVVGGVEWVHAPAYVVFQVQPA